MKLKFKAEHPGAAAEAAVFLFENQPDLKDRPDLGALRGVIEPLLKNKAFMARPLAELPLRTEKGWLLLVGLGPRDRVTPDRMAEASAAAVKLALARQCRNLTAALPPLDSVPAEDALELAGVGSLLALYRQTEFKTGPHSEPSLRSVTWLAPEAAGGAAALKRAEAMAGAALLARRLGNAPANILYPETFAAEARSLAAPLGLKVKVWDERGLAREKMHLVLAVGRGSARPPRLVTIDYRGGRAAAPPLALIGKGVTFDSGGLSLKPAAGLEGMKTDMAGAATALAVVLAAARMKIPVNLTAIMPLAENMPDGAAFRVGDVFASRSGRTVEVANTDAEGRLLLADALTLAAEMKPAAVIDLATLTGACAVALGDRCAGLFTDDENLRSRLLAASGAMGEPCWPLPLLNEYDDSLKSETADLASHTGQPRGGAVSAALFLRRFVPPGLPWAHLDIAGPARAGRARPGVPVGATGFGARTLLRFLLQWGNR